MLLACVQSNEIFLTKVTAWQRQLGLVDASLSTWQDVQKLWQALESIYIGSEDIQKQLPEDAQRFNANNVQLKASLVTSFPVMLNRLALLSHPLVSDPLATKDFECRS